MGMSRFILSRTAITSGILLSTLVGLYVYESMTIPFWILALLWLVGTFASLAKARSQWIAEEERLAALLDQVANQ